MSRMGETTMDYPDNPEALQSIDELFIFNGTRIQEVMMDINFAWLLFSLILAMSWVVYIAFYSSRVTGLLLTKVANRFFIKNGHLYIGSLSLSALSGKVMFRDLVYVTEDFSLRVQDGWLIFRWWRAYVPKDISEDMSHSDTRLSILLNGFEYHLYNRSELYSRLENLFGLDPLVILGGYADPVAEEGKSHPKPPSAVGYSWRDLIPVIKLEFTSGRVVFGNTIVPYTLAVVVEESHLIYTTKPAASRLDHFMHIVKCRAENFKVLLSQTPKYTGLKDEPPRLMGEGFGILTSNKVELYYYMDEPGLVPAEPEMLQLANGEFVEANPPIWGIDIKCGKGTDFSYGPWADRQRELLYKLFFPQDYEPLKQTKAPKAGEERQIQSFDIRLSTLNDATIDILFSKDEETNAIHMNIGPGSYLEVTIPWVVHLNGYTTKITGQLLHLEASTSLQFRDFVESETLEFNVKSQYPIHWNDHQEWSMTLTGCKATAYLIYAHKWFFQALINDWGSRTPPDLLHFVPYTWRISFCLKEFEIITTTNEFNWIDCSSQHHENLLLGACGEVFELSFDLPFDEFLPETVLFKFWIQVEGGDLNFFVPDTSTGAVALESLTRNAKIRDRDGRDKWNLSEASSPSGKVKKWRNVCLTSERWIECWKVPIVAVSIGFNYHPMPPLGPSPQADVTTPEKEEILLSPMRMAGGAEVRGESPCDPLSLPPDTVHVECEVGPSDILLYGTLLKLIINLKENIFGEFQDFVDMERLRSGTGTPTFTFKPPPQRREEPKFTDMRVYRPLEVTVSATIHDVRGHLLKNCNERDPPCPTICVERFGFEMDKKYRETTLQVLLSPIMLIVTDTIERLDSGDNHLKDGYLMLSALQVRGHAMFSGKGRSLDEETLEYAWLIEILLGKLSGRLTAAQAEGIVEACEAFFMAFLDVENDLRPPYAFLQCHHGENQFECPKTITTVCPTPEDLKYKMVRVALDAADIYLVEGGSALSLWISPIRAGLCNLHGRGSKEGLTVLLPSVQVRHLVMVNPSFTKRFQFSDLNVESSSDTVTGSLTSRTESLAQSPGSATCPSYLWLEAGAIGLGPLCVETALKGNSAGLQTPFLHLHDDTNRKLWFLWRGASCSCVGGSEFFGKNAAGPRFFWPSAKDWTDGSNVASFRVNPSGEDPGFGQSILKEGTLMFDTPPYTTGGGVSLLQLPSEWGREPPPKSASGKAPFTFRPSLLADSSAPSSSGPSKGSRSSTLTSRRLSHPTHSLLRRQSKVGDLAEESHLRLPTIPRTASTSSDSKIPSDFFGPEEEKQISSIPQNGLRESGGLQKTQWMESSTSLDSLSDVSFISALSVQEECMVNLQMHLNKPIVESSLLMPCYMSHLTQLKCDNWHVAAPTAASDSLGFAPFLQTTDGKLIYAGSKYTPYFEPLVDGFTTLAMVNVEGDDGSPSTPMAEKSPTYSERKTRDEGSDDAFYRSILFADVETAVDSTTVIVRTKNDINIMLSPMLLEAAQKFIEAVTPSQCLLHPMTVMTRLHRQCISRVEKANTLKKEKALLLARIQGNRRGTGIRSEEASPSHTALYEEISRTAIQGSISLPKVNITLLQASVVEEVISFSALDNIRDLMCVSLLAVAIEETEFHFLLREETKKSVQVLHRPSILPKAAKKRKSKISTSDSLLSEPVFIENAEAISELLSVSVDIRRIHGQLRRLKNDSSILREAVITAIPNQHSKVLFRFAKVPSRLSDFRDSTTSETLRENGDDLKGFEGKRWPDEKLGFIMAECGLEGISFKGLKHSESPHKNEDKEETASVTLCNEAGDESPFTATIETLASDVPPPPVVSPPSVSCVLLFKTMWYNFAAPPQTPITRKIDYTRVDWNLLSTASTAINAWLNPIDQLTIGVLALFRGGSKRVTGLLASLMAEALEIQGIHQPPKSKYGKLTGLAKTLQEDPSCQLCVVITRYVLRTALEAIEANVSESRMPQLSTLRQGVIVLSRQWKNVLYTPLLLEHNLKAKKPKNFTVQFTLPQSEEESPGSEGEMSAEETTDERATLLDTDGPTTSLHSATKRSRESIASSVSGSIEAKGLPFNVVPSSTHTSDVYNPRAEPNEALLSNHVKEKLTGQGTSVGSIVTGDWSLSSESGRSSPVRGGSVVKQVKEWRRTSGETPRLSALVSEVSHEESLLLGAHSKFPQHPSLMLLDAHVIFQPLLTSLGLMPQQIMGYDFDHWGSHASLRASIDSLRIDITESEGKGARPRKPNLHPETPAFLCEKIVLECDIQKSTDPSQLLNKKSMIYLSRNYCKKQAKSALVFAANIDYISQQVNMPLLRLLHQITTMYHNVRETQMELREARPATNPHSAAAHKNSSSSGSDIQDAGKVSTPIPPDPPPEPENNQNNIRIPVRAQSLAQRLKSTGKAVRGQIGGIEVRGSSASQTPTSVRGPPHFLEGKVESVGGPSCWKTIYYLLDLYATRPETKTILNREDPYPRRLKPQEKDVLDEAVEKGVGAEIPTNYASLEKAKDIIGLEPPRLSIFGVARIRRTRLLASLSGLKLEAEIFSLQASSSYKKKLRPASVDCSLTGHVGEARIVLLEGAAPSQQTVVRVSVSQSGALYSSVSRRSKDRNWGLLTVGPVCVDIPQHPVVLHGMMTRSTKQLSSTLQEFRVNRASSRISRGTTFDEADFAAHVPAAAVPHIPPERRRGKNVQPALFQPLAMQFVVVVESLAVSAALLPSLTALYKMESVKAAGVTGGKAKFSVHLPAHHLSFESKLSVEANLPSEASISLPQVHVAAEVLTESKGPADALAVDAVLSRHGYFLSASADIGAFEHCLTTDLLNHLVFVQKVFMKEVNEVVLKMSGGDKPVPLWEDESASSLRSLLFTLVVRLQSIQITATTPTNTAVRLETGLLEFQMSNRDQGTVLRPSRVNTNKVFLKAQVDLNLSLGQLIRNIVFEEADSEYQEYAFFKTRIGLRNVLSDDSSGSENEKEIVLITLSQPLVYVQPIAVDKAILVWLNYKNAYEYWNEQRSTLNTEVLAAMPPQLIPASERNQVPDINEQSSTLFLQLTVDDMGISIPLNPSHSWGGRGESENRGAVVVTLESTSISACSSGSLVSTGRFNGLCFRFTDDMVSMDDWKPNLSDHSLMNLCVVSEGTYEVCSRTTSQHQTSENAKWFLNVKWSMEGVDMHIDVNVGKQLSALGHTLTSLAAFEEEEDDEGGDRLFHDVLDYGGTPLPPSRRSYSQESMVIRKGGDSIPNWGPDPDPRHKRTILEKEMQERVSRLAELKRSGASHKKIEEERTRIQELETLAYKDFRRDWIKKLRRQSTKASSIKDKLGLGSKRPLQNRSKSFIASSPVVDSPVETVRPVEGRSGESSPVEGRSRTASLRFSHRKTRVTFGDAQRQFSVDATNIPTPDDEDDFIGVWLDESMESPIKEGAEDGKEFGHLTPGSSVSQAHKPLEPNVDLELDVKVFVNSGKCVLHTKWKDEDAELRVRKKSERSGSGFDSLLHISSPVGSRKTKANLSSSKIKSPFIAGPTDFTIFHIPGLDVKIHYNSHISYEERGGEWRGHERSDSGSSGGIISGRKGGTKKGSLFAWTTLHSVPEETIISPHILDFLEQTLEPIPVNQQQQKSFESGGTEAASAVASTYYASFPVDVVVYFHMQPSTFRFSCQPVSRVECMLRLPSLDIVFSSKRADGEAPESRRRPEPIGKEMKDVSIGGLSVTGCLSDFSLYIFHPYGAAKKSADWSPLSDNERKDSVSMNVEFIKFHLVRSRKIHLGPTGDPKTNSSSETHQAAIRFSTIVDIGSASFKYDMRRLTEILAFPKAWYRRSIVRRLFLGDLSTPSGFGDEAGSIPKSEERRVSFSHPTFTQREKLRLNFEDHRKRVRSKGNLNGRGDEANNKEHSSGIPSWETLVLFTVNFTKLNVQMNMGNVMGNVSWMIRDAKSEGRFSIGSKGHRNLYIGIGLDSSYIDAKGGIVAGTFELSRLNTFVRGKEDPGVEPQHTVGFKMFGLELRLDFMGTSVLMGRVSGLEVILKDEWQVHHRSNSESNVSLATYRPAMIFIHGDMGWDQLQLMISKSTTVDLLKMHCKLEEFFSQQFKSSKWIFSTLQVQENHGAHTRPAKKIKKKPSESGMWEEFWHHRHWQQVLGKVSGSFLASLANPLPDTGTVLGGTMDLHGSNISLACFHGVNFKAKSWALFSLKQPFISFSTEAQETHSQDKGACGSVHVVQNLNFSLGQYNTAAMSINSSLHESMAMVCRITRNVMFPPQFRTLQEWFHYAFAPSEIDDVQRFPSLERERERMDRLEAGNVGERRTPARLHDPNHNREVIFALPSMELFFKTEHLQAFSTPDAAGNRPTVECSFITEFGDHIFVTVDAEAFFFLHDLITSYVKEKEKLVYAQLAAGRSVSPAMRLEEGQKLSTSTSSSSSTEGPTTLSSSLPIDEEAFQRDWRDYQCKTWQLEPTVRLLSWAGKSIEPYGVDYILHKLGFSHARITIPKWMQRGFMDPLDKVLSILVFRMIDLAKTDGDSK